MDKIQQAVNEQVNDLLKERVSQAVEESDISGSVTQYLQRRLDNPNFKSFVGDQILTSVSGLNVNGEVINLIEKQVQTTINTQIPAIQKLVRERVDSILLQTIEQLVRSFSFPESSIPAKSINWENYSIDSQLISNLPKPNPGIEDISDRVNLTVMNDAVVVETNLVSKHIEAENITVTNLHLKNTHQPWIGAIAKHVEQNVRQHDYSVDINKIAVKFDEQVNKIRGDIKRSTQLKELDVSGESYLSGVLYTTPGNKRVGINTMEPSDALTVWDQEAEVVIGKHASQEGYIGTRRRQAVNIGSNNNVGIRITPVGEVEINKLNLCGRTISTSAGVPGDAAKQGDIRLNTKPQNGEPIGWVCIDGNRWSSFGIIE
jgi:hypothetical protein|tara:strand:- start:5696 stop:6817 length:1122 start_codon:yes stop_codon:yes gene_type:complete